MSIEMRIIIAITVVIILMALAVVYWLIPKRLKRDRYMQRWLDLQKQLKDPAQWSDALLKADGMLDEALRKRKFKGSSMGERMVSAQKFFSKNDELWLAHNLCKKLKSTTDVKLKENNVKSALVAFRQALRDLGALDNAQSRDNN